MKALGLVLLLVGCSSIHTQVAGWPQDMKVTHHIVEYREVFDTCYKYLTTLDKLLLSVPLACAEIDLDNNTCDITRTKNTFQFVIDHEEAHCKGGDHDGILQALFAEWKSSQQSRPQTARREK